MPNYEFMCPDCGRTSTLFFLMDDQPVVTCSRCNVELRKVYTVPGVVFKGNGWASKS